MRQEALEKLPAIRDELEDSVRDILADEPDGVRHHRIRGRIFKHTESDVDANAKYLFVWLAELNQDGVIVYDAPNKRYLHPRHAEKESEAYRQQTGRPPSGLGSSDRD